MHSNSKGCVTKHQVVHYPGNRSRPYGHPGTRPGGLPGDSWSVALRVASQSCGVFRCFLYRMSRETVPDAPLDPGPRTTQIEEGQPPPYWLISSTTLEAFHQQSPFDGASGISRGLRRPLDLLAPIRCHRSWPRCSLIPHQRQCSPPRRRQLPRYKHNPQQSTTTHYTCYPI